MKNGVTRLQFTALLIICLASIGARPYHCEAMVTGTSHSMELGSGLIQAMDSNLVWIQIDSKKYSVSDRCLRQDMGTLISGDRVDYLFNNRTLTIVCIKKINSKIEMQK